MISIAVLCSLFLSTHLFSVMFHNNLDHESHSNTYQWEQQCDTPFDELIISWNAERPQKGHYAIYASIKTEGWSDWLPYALWGTDFQKTFDSGKDDCIRSYQDTIELSENKKGTAFRIQVRAEEGASLKNFYRLHASATDLSQFSSDLPLSIDEKSIPRLPVPPISQMALSDNRRSRFCSPSSLMSLICFYNKNTSPNVIELVDKVYDQSWKIFGNWVFNVAEAAALLGKNYLCYVERVEDFTTIFNHLRRHCPVIISIKGPIPKGALPYQSGHLLVVAGYNADTQSFACMDPAFEKDQDTYIEYKATDLITAWNRRKRVAYIIHPLQ